MTDNPNHWPIYDSPKEMLAAETSGWGERLEIANMRYALLEGELPRQAEHLVFAIVDAHTERPEHFSLLDIYQRQGVDPSKSGALISVNYERGHSQKAEDLADAIAEQRERTSIPAAVSIMSYPYRRRIDELRKDIWDVGVAHALWQRPEYSIVGVSNDADMVDASPDYSGNMTQNRYVELPAQIWGSEVEFSMPGGPDLPLHRLIAYMSEGKRLMSGATGRPVMFGASIGCTLETYVAANGWSGNYGGANPYGIREPERLIVNAWERLTGQEGSMDKDGLAEPYRRCARRVGGIAVVSPRREILAFARKLGQEGNVGAELNTEPDNPYRSLSNDQIAELAASVSADDPLFIAQLDRLDEGALNYAPPHTRSALQRARRAMRERMGFPPNTQMGSV